MPKQRLQQLLSDLKRELSSGDDLTPEDIDALQGLVSSLHDVIDENMESDDESILSDLKDVRTRFESTHPKLTDALASVSELLRSIGIS